MKRAAKLITANSVGPPRVRRISDPDLADRLAADGVRGRPESTAKCPHGSVRLHLIICLAGVIFDLWTINRSVISRIQSFPAVTVVPRIEIEGSNVRFSHAGQIGEGYAMRQSRNDLQVNSVDNQP